MPNQNIIWIQRIKRVSIVFLVFALLGCSSARGGTEDRPVLPVSAQEIAAGDVENGQKLFMGYAHFQNDGPPCMGCHSVGNNGLLGGGALGSDLTNVSKKLNQQEIISILSNSGQTLSPVMQPIYTEHPLTGIEQADLIAFMGASAGQPETNKEWIVILISLVGVVAVVVVLGFIYRGRLRGVRKTLVRRASEN